MTHRHEKPNDSFEPECSISLRTCNIRLMTETTEQEVLPGKTDGKSNKGNFNKKLTKH